MTLSENDNTLLAKLLKLTKEDKIHWVPETESVNSRYVCRYDSGDEYVYQIAISEVFGHMAGQYLYSFSVRIYHKGISIGDKGFTLNALAAGLLVELCHCVQKILNINYDKTSKMLRDPFSELLNVLPD